MRFVKAMALLAGASPMLAQYGGPAILIRGQAPSAMTAGQIDFQPFLSLNGTYNTGLGGVSVDPQGKPTNDASYGGSVAAGVSGTHSWKHTKLGLNYSISAQHYAQASFFDGINQSLALGITHVLTRHSALAFNVSAGISSSYNTGLTLISTVPFDPSTLYQPTNDFYDNRTVFLSSRIAYTIQKSTRLSFNFAGDGFLTRRRSTALYGVGGLGARGDMQYRLTRRSSVGAGYSFTHFAFNGIFSSTDVHNFVGSYSVTLTRSTEFTAYGGVAHYETKFAQTVPVDPAIAALIGISNANVVVYNSSPTGTYGARISRVVRKGTLFLTGGRGITPGNGLFLTSTSTNFTGGYSYGGLRRWSLSAAGMYSTSQSIGNVIGNYSNYSATLNAGRKVAPHTTGVLAFTMTHAGSTDFHNYNRWQYAVNLGLTFSPGDIAIRFW